MCRETDSNPVGCVTVREFQKPLWSPLPVCHVYQTQNIGIDIQLGDMEEEGFFNSWPSLPECAGEATKLGRIALPLIVAGLLFYARSVVSMLFLGRLGELELSGGALSIGFANITGYSVLTGLAMGMEPICGQAFGAKQWKLLGLTMQRTILLLFCASVPIGCLWLSMKKILLWCGQDPEVTAMAYSYILYSIPDLVTHSLLHPLRIFLRTQNVTLPLSWCAAAAFLLHVPINFLLVDYAGMGIRGVALAAAFTNLHMVTFLTVYLLVSGKLGRCWPGWSRDCLRQWKPLLSLAIPSCLSVCLEWWCYELMIILSGLLVNPKATVASMGILIQITALVYLFPSSLSNAASVRVSNELGANQPKRARFSALVALLCSAFMGIGAMCFTTSLSHRWGQMFTGDPDILKLTAAAMPIVGLCELGNSPQTTGCGVLRGSARPSTGANVNLASFYAVGMPVAVVLVFVVNVGFVGLWLGMLAAQLSCVISMLFVMSRTDWVAQAKRAQEITGGSTPTTPFHLHVTDYINPEQQPLPLPLYVLTNASDHDDGTDDDNDNSNSNNNSNINDDVDNDKVRCSQKSPLMLDAELAL